MISANVAFPVATLAVSAVAAIFDWRTRRIPNVVTLGGLALGFPLHAWLAPPVTGFESAALGAFACAVPALVAWRLGWMGGGDVKLIAAMGSLGGISYGLESVFLTLFCASAFIFLRLSWNGAFFRTFGNGLAVVASRGLMRRRPIAPVAEFSSSLRLGPFALAGAVMSLFFHGVIG